MIFRPPTQADWDIFLALAAAENWRVPQFELRLFRGSWAQYAHVLDADGFCGLVTAVAHEKSGWIGNLIVPQVFRGQGYGSRLFRFAVENLLERKMTSVWLTASEEGRPIYEKVGFIKVGAIERWVLPPAGAGGVQRGSVKQTAGSLPQADQKIWRENRSALLNALAECGQVYSVGKSVALLQLADDVQVVGPWYSDDAVGSANVEVLEKVVAAADPAVELVADVIETPERRRVFEACGFHCTGQTALMVYGEIGAVDLRRMISLASLGSFG